MQRIQPANPADNAQLKATYDRMTKTRGYVANILMSLSHAPEGLERFAACGEYVRYVREFAKGNVGDDTFDELRKHYSERKITDLTLLAGYFMALGSTISAFRIALEPNFPAKAKATK
jgi:hypothetical protein